MRIDGRRVAMGLNNGERYTSVKMTVSTSTSANAFGRLNDRAPFGFTLGGTPAPEGRVSCSTYSPSESRSRYR
ncbi:MAG TPA: hypothetical protein VK436_13790 [Methanocella sp.]|nr:hypothetical protein [Methanocella sp.]